MLQKRNRIKIRELAVFSHAIHIEFDWKDAIIVPFLQNRDTE